MPGTAPRRSRARVLGVGVLDAQFVRHRGVERYQPVEFSEEYDDEHRVLVVPRCELDERAPARAWPMRAGGHCDGFHDLWGSHFAGATVTARMVIDAVGDYLARDHRQLDELLAEVDRWMERDLAEAGRRFEAFSSRLDRHIEIEEALLFPAYETVAGDAGRATTAELREDHVEIRAAIEVLRQAIREGRTAHYADGSQVLDLLLGGHNLKEESGIYPDMDDALARSPKLAALFEGFRTNPGSGILASSILKT